VLLCYYSCHSSQPPHQAQRAQALARVDFRATVLFFVSLIPAPTPSTKSTSTSACWCSCLSSRPPHQAQRAQAQALARVDVRVSHPGPHSKHKEHKHLHVLIFVSLILSHTKHKRLHMSNFLLLCYFVSLILPRTKHKEHKHLHVLISVPVLFCGKSDKRDLTVVFANHSLTEALSPICRVGQTVHTYRIWPYICKVGHNRISINIGIYSTVYTPYNTGGGGERIYVPYFPYHKSIVTIRRIYAVYTPYFRIYAVFPSYFHTKMQCKTVFELYTPDWGLNPSRNSTNCSLGSK